MMPKIVLAALANLNNGKMPPYPQALVNPNTINAVAETLIKASSQGSFIANETHSPLPNQEFLVQYGMLVAALIISSMGEFFRVAIPRLRDLDIERFPCDHANGIHAGVRITHTPTGTTTTYSEGAHSGQDAAMAAMHMMDALFTHNLTDRSHKPDLIKEMQPKAEPKADPPLPAEVQALLDEARKANPDKEFHVLTVGADNLPPELLEVLLKIIGKR